MCIYIYRDTVYVAIYRRIHIINYMIQSFLEPHTAQFQQKVAFYQYYGFFFPPQHVFVSWAWHRPSLAEPVTACCCKRVATSNPSYLPLKIPNILEENQTHANKQNQPDLSKLWRKLAELPRESPYSIVQGFDCFEIKPLMGLGFRFGMNTFLLSHVSWASLAMRWWPLKTGPANTSTVQIRFKGIQRICKDWKNVVHSQGWLTAFLLSHKIQFHDGLFQRGKPKKVTARWIYIGIIQYYYVTMFLCNATVVYIIV